MCTLKGRDYFDGPSVFIKIILNWIEKMKLRKIFGPKRNEVTGEWTRLYKGQFCDLRGKAVPTPT
jgi:hypothetical protein